MRARTQRFENYVSVIAEQLGHADRVEPFRSYCTGLLLPVQRKSVESMAAHLAPANVRSEHQRLHQFLIVLSRVVSAHSLAFGLGGKEWPAGLLAC